MTATARRPSALQPRSQATETPTRIPAIPARRTEVSTSTTNKNKNAVTTRNQPRKTHGK